jgi:phosphatidate cytidylyltransferase
MSLLQNNLFLRVASALALFPVVVWLIAHGGWYLRGLMIAATVIGLHEYGRAVSPTDLVARVLLVAVGTLSLVVGLISNELVPVLFALQLGVLTMGAVTVLRPGEDLPRAFQQLTAWVFVLFWVVPPLVSVARLRDLGEALPSTGRASLVLIVLLATWSNDTFAYFAGRLFGKHKMAGAISPKKTWEGFAGGMIGSVAFLAGLSTLLPAYFPSLTLIDAVCVGVPVSFLGPMGDLVESLWKRAVGIKDSGNILPGHGGILDRIDAVFFTAPWVLAYFAWVKPTFL